MTEFWNSQSCTSHILSYLNMADMEALCETHSYLEFIIHSYLENGNQLIIDKDCIYRFPVKENNILYTKYGTLTTNLMITKLDSIEVFSHFVNVTTLSMHSIHILESPFLHSLTYLTLHGCLIRGDTLLSWLSGLQETLISLHMIKLILDCRSIEPPMYLEQGFSQLQSLTLIEFKIPVNDLRITSPVLNHLKVDTTTYKFNWADYHGLPIRSLELTYCWQDSECDQYRMIRSLQSLTHLKIRRSVDPKQKPQIDALNLKSVDVHYLDAPKEENMIFNLNVDCLRYLNRFLSLEDSVSLSICHSGFKGLLPLKNRTYTVDKESLKRYPVNVNTEFYARTGQWVTNLIVKDITAVEFDGILPFFTEVETLILFALSEELPEETDYMSKVFRSWNMKLKKLVLGQLMSPVLESLPELHNIDSFTCFGVMVTPKVLQFLSQNKHHMREFSVLAVDGLLGEFYAVLGEMQHLKKLELIRGGRKVLANGTFPELETLGVSVYEEDKDLALTVANLNAPKIRTLELYNQPLIFAEAIKTRMPGVTELGFRGQMDMAHDYKKFYAELFGLRFLNLTKLRLPDEINIETKDIVWLLEVFPNLKELDTKAHIEPDIFFFLKYVLVRSGRGLIFKKSEIVKSIYQLLHL